MRKVRAKGQQAGASRRRLVGGGLRVASCAGFTRLADLVCVLTATLPVPTLHKCRQFYRRQQVQGVYVFVLRVTPLLCCCTLPSTLCVVAPPQLHPHHDTCAAALSCIVASTYLPCPAALGLLKFTPCPSLPLASYRSRRANSRSTFSSSACPAPMAFSPLRATRANSGAPRPAAASTPRQVLAPASP